MKRVTERLSTIAIVTVGMAVVLFFEWHTDEPLVVLPVLLATCFFAGLAVPRHFVVAGMLLGWAILVAHSASNETGLLIPRYQHQPPDAADWLAMSLLVVPALAAAFSGAKARTLVFANTD